MTRQTFVLCAARVIGAVSAFWLVQNLIALVRTVGDLRALFPDHHIFYFPVIETFLALTLAVAGLIIGLRATQIANRFEATPSVPHWLPLLAGLGAAVYMTGMACRAAIQLGTIESVRSYGEYRFYGTEQRARLGYSAQTTQLSRMAEPAVALACLAVVSVGLIPKRRHSNP